jgi:hypothetical protein
LLGEQYIPPAFRPVVVPPQLEPVYNTLLSPTAPRLQRNYVVGSLMDILHTADLEKYALRHDSRITYIPGDSRYKRMFDSDIRVSRYGTYDCQMNYTKMGDWSGLSLVGDMFTWSISPSKGRVSITDYTGRIMSGDLRFNLATVSSKVALIPGFLDVYFKAPAGVIDSTSDKFLLGVTNVEPFDIGAMVSRLQFELGRSPRTAEFLFALKPPYEDDMAVFKALWDNYPDTVYQLAGITLALGYRLNEC